LSTLLLLESTISSRPVEIFLKNVKIKHSKIRAFVQPPPALQPIFYPCRQLCTRPWVGISISFQSLFHFRTTIIQKTILLGEEETWESGRRREKDNGVLGFGNVSEALRTCMVHTCTLVRSGFNSSKCLYRTIPLLCIFKRVSMNILLTASTGRVTN
jgi:hypothetical protein